MSILARNIQTIRKELKCTQGAMAEILKVGFRTYVRYEAGERDAPVSVLVMLSRLGNISLERLLTEEMDRHQLVPVMGERLDNPVPEIKSCDMKRGVVKFKTETPESLITLGPSETKLLACIRKIPELEQSAFLKNLGKKYKATRSGKGVLLSTVSAEDEKNREAQSRMLGQAGAIKPDAECRPGKPGRKKLNRKSLREKISKLKSVTQSIRKITVG